MSQDIAAAEAKPGFKIHYPRIHDARWALLVFLLAYVTYSVQSIGFNRSPAQFATAAGTCLLLDLFFLFYKKVPLVPLSGLITSFGVTLLCDSPHIWPYSFVAAMSILSKHLIRTRKRHVFNPNNFGIVVGFLYLGGFMTVAAGRWGGFSKGAMLVAAIGSAVAFRAKRLPLALSYVMSFVMGVGVRSFLLDRPLMTIGAPMTGAAFPLFVFYMVTDPVTTPSSWKGQILFGFAVGALDTILRLFQLKYAPFLSLFVMCAVNSFIEAISDLQRERPWALGQIKVGAT